MSLLHESCLSYQLEAWPGGENGALFTSLPDLIELDMLGREDEYKVCVCMECC